MSFLYKTKYIALALVLVCVGCTHHHAHHSINASSIIVVFGDSLTYGTGVAKNESYPALLSKSLGCQVINAGVPGEITDEGLRRLPHVIEKYHPDLLVLCLGGNDMLRKRPRQRTIDNLDAMLNMLQSEKIDTVLLGVPQPNLILETPDFYKKLAHKYNVPIDYKTIPRILSDRSLKSDRIHPNATGYRKMADAVEKLINESR